MPTYHSERHYARVQALQRRIWLKDNLKYMVFLTLVLAGAVIADTMSFNTMQQACRDLNQPGQHYFDTCNQYQG